ASPGTSDEAVPAGTGEEETIMDALLTAQRHEMEAPELRAAAGWVADNLVAKHGLVSTAWVGLDVRQQGPEGAEERPYLRLVGYGLTTWGAAKVEIRSWTGGAMELGRPQAWVVAADLEAATKRLVRIARVEISDREVVLTDGRRRYALARI